mmetsp:Transcript_4470/g.16901  ORF Transcript_4470/g.16901 Transcript_4470/m.16901 type:complete len:83 (+) Transcript_4470:2458-2706(+)
MNHKFDALCASDGQHSTSNVKSNPTVSGLPSLSKKMEKQLYHICQQQSQQKEWKCCHSKDEKCRFHRPMIDGESFVHGKYKL